MKPILLFLLALSGSAHSYLGVGVAEVASEEHGVEIKFIADNSPAAKAGLKADDVILELNGQRIEGISQFTRLIAESPAGRKVNFLILRANARLNIMAVPEARSGVPFPLPPIPPMPSIVMPDLPRASMSWRNGMLGIETEALNTQLAEYFGVKGGILVRMVTRQSPAEKAGMKAGDIIIKADGKPVSATRDVTGLLPSRKSITLGIVRNHKDVTLEVNLDGS